MRYALPLSLTLAAALVLAGAGCQKNPDTYVPPSPAEVSPSAPEPEAPAEVTEPVSTSTSPSSTVEQPIVNPAPLAFPGVLPDNEVNKKVRIKTTIGDIVIQVEKNQGPNAASNFVYLVKNSFYNGTIFHRVIPGFMIQGGDPTGTGTSGPGYQFANDPVKSPYNKGIVAMANAGRDTNGSQFFIMVADVGLQPDYSVFGHVISGQDVADKIAAVARDGNDRPNADVKMTSVMIE